MTTPPAEISLGRNGRRGIAEPYSGSAEQRLVSSGAPRPRGVAWPNTPPCQGGDRRFESDRDGQRVRRQHGRRVVSADDQAVVPMIAYEDGSAAMDWLARAFGFHERTRMLDATGRLTHGEMDTGGGLIMLATPSQHYESPRHHREVCG